MRRLIRSELPWLVMYLKTALLFFYLAYTEAKKCPEIRLAKNFNLTAFASGVWHDLAKYPNEIEASENCMTTRYAYNGDIITIKNVVPVNGPNFMDATGRLQPDGSIYFTGLTGCPKKSFEVSVTVVQVKGDKFAIKYNCIENGDDIIEMVWVVSRFWNLDDCDKEELNKFIKSSKFIDMDRLFWIKFSDKLCNKK